MATLLAQRILLSQARTTLWNDLVQFPQHSDWTFAELLWGLFNLPLEAHVG